MGKLKIIYEDNHILVAEKPPGLLSQSNGRDDTDMLSQAKAYIKEKYQKSGNVYLGLMHRLDKPVGGAMLFARTSKAAGRLNEQMRKRKIEKLYLAVVEGQLDRKEDLLEDRLKKDRKNNISRISDADDAKSASLKYRVISEKEGYSLVLIRLHTGRSHQIRLQFSNIGHPVAGDRKYGSGDAHHTVALWAFRIGFEHPVKKESVVFVSLPEDRGIWKRFEVKGDYDEI